MRRFLLAAAISTFAGCSGGAPGGPGASSADAQPSADLPIASPIPPKPSSAPAPPSGAPALAASDAPAEAREAAALRALLGAADPKLLAVEATENGQPLDPSVRDKLAPRGRPPQVKMGATSVTGRLPPEVIQRIVRQVFGRFRLCYETALETDPLAEGKVEVKFTIDTQGAVKNVVEGASTIKDKAMRSCVLNAFETISFPQPEGGIVTVTYPIQFSPPVD